MTSKYDIIKLFENMLDEKQINKDEVFSGLETVSKQIDNRKLRAPENKSKNTITSKKNKDQNEDDETDLDSKKSVPKDLQPNFEMPQEEEVDNDSISLEDAHDFSSFIDTCNLFRAAGSLKDKEVSERLKVYFERMTPGERQAIHVLLKGLTQIANLVKDGSNADIPSKSGIKISHAQQQKPKEEEDNEKEDREKEYSKPSKPAKKPIKQKPAVKQKPKTKGLNPISVVPEGRSIQQDKSEILKLLNELKN